MINYQIMDESNLTTTGRYFPDYQKLMDGAETQEEKDYIKKVSEYPWNTFVFNMVTIVKQACGHYEIFQHPMNAYHNLDETLKLDIETAKTRKCTHCICNFK
jgi:hypothetical protein